MTHWGLKTGENRKLLLEYFQLFGWLHCHAWHAVTTTSNKANLFFTQRCISWHFTIEMIQTEFHYYIHNESRFVWLLVVFVQHFEWILVVNCHLINRINWTEFETVSHVPAFIILGYSGVLSKAQSCIHCSFSCLFLCCPMTPTCPGCTKSHPVTAGRNWVDSSVSLPRLCCVYCNQLWLRQTLQTRDAW